MYAPDLRDRCAPIIIIHLTRGAGAVAVTESITRVFIRLIATRYFWEYSGIVPTAGRFIDGGPDAPRVEKATIINATLRRRAGGPDEQRACRRMPFRAKRHFRLGNGGFYWPGARLPPHPRALAIFRNGDIYFGAKDVRLIDYQG